MLAIANLDRVITITPLGGWIPGAPTYGQTPSVKSKVRGASLKAVLLDKLTWSMAGCTATGKVFVSGGSGVTPIAATSTKVTDKNLNKKPLRITDSGVCNGTFTDGGTVYNCKCNFVITNAGQTKTVCN